MGWVQVPEPAPPRVPGSQTVRSPQVDVARPVITGTEASVLNQPLNTSTPMLVTDAAVGPGEHCS